MDFMLWRMSQTMWMILRLLAWKTTFWGILMFLILFFGPHYYFNRLKNFIFSLFLIGWYLVIVDYRAWVMFVNYFSFSVNKQMYISFFLNVKNWAIIDMADIRGPSHVCENAFNVEFQNTYRRQRQWNCGNISTWGQ